MRSFLCYFLIGLFFSGCGPALDPLSVPEETQFGGFVSEGAPVAPVEGETAVAVPASDSDPLFAEEDDPGKVIVSYSTLSPVAFAYPTSSVVKSPVFFEVAAEPEVVRVEYMVKHGENGDWWTLGESATSADGFAVTFPLQGSGERVLCARAYGLDGSLLGMAWKGVFLSPEGPEVELSPKIHFLSPETGDVSNPVSFVSVAQGDVQSVRYVVEAAGDGLDWLAGQSSDATGGFQLQYSFNEGGPKTVRVQGLNGDGNVVSEDTRIVNVVLPGAAGAESDECGEGQVPDCNGLCSNANWVGDGYCDDGKVYDTVYACPQFQNDGGDCGEDSENPSTGLCQAGYVLDCLGNCAPSGWLGDGYCDDGSATNVDLFCAAYQYDSGDCGSNPSSAAGISGVPYFYQYANTYYPSTSSQNTSIAMVLGYYGWEGTPDTLSMAYGNDAGQSPSGLAGVFNEVAEQDGLSQRLVAHEDGTIDGLRALLVAGKPVIVHGLTTSFGHVVVVTGYSSGHYTVNDPAGLWNLDFKGGYPYGWDETAGNAVTYPAEAFELAISSTNGYNQQPVWYHEVTE